MVRDCNARLADQASAAVACEKTINIQGSPSLYSLLRVGPCLLHEAPFRQVYNKKFLSRRHPVKEGIVFKA